jgi:P27 family predicted phage terminase small subunit
MSNRNRLTVEALLNGDDPAEIEEDNELRQSKKPTLPRGVVMKRARDLYHELAPILYDMDALEIIDGPTLTLMLIHYGIAAEAAKKIREEGLTDIDEQGIVRKSPLLQILRDATQQYRQLSKQFPISPKIRKQLKMDGYFIKNLEDDDPFSDI